MEITVYSWNILHIIHEFNYVINSSPVLDKYNITKTNTIGEERRIFDIYKMIIKLLNKDSIFCLQEVPDDLLQVLTKLKEYKVYSHAYNTIPNIKDNTIKSPYINNGEHLVTIIPNSLKDSVVNMNSIQFDDKDKDGFVLNFDFGLSLINAHVPFNSHNRLKSIQSIYDYLQKTNYKNYIIIGDMNCSNENLAEDLITANFSDYYIPKIEGFTRKGKQNGNIIYSKLDHAIVHNSIEVINTSIIDPSDMSDHFIIKIDIILKK